MKKLFSRDKAKGKVAPSDIGTGLPLEGYFNSPSVRGDRSQSGTPIPPEEHWNLVDDDAQSYTVRSTHSPSLQSSVPSSLVSTPRALQPANTAPISLQSTPKNGERDRAHPILRKKAPNGQSAFAAVGILRALDPHIEVTHPPEVSEDGLTDVSYREEKKEKRGFWERAGVNKEKDKDRERDRVREREREKEMERKEDDPHAELTRMIGYLTATASEDWSLVLEVCERASSNEATAKEAAKALRREFKYAEPSAQLSAARLWAIMLRNSSEVFIWQCASRKFLDTLEDVINSSRTSPVVRERLLEVLAAAAYASVNGSKESAFRSLWRKLKPADKPDEGIPFDTGDAMFYPPTPRHPPSNAQPAPDHRNAPSQRPAPTVLPSKPKTSSRPRVIPPEEDIRRLFQECKIGRGNASLLSEALTFARPEDLKLKEIIKEFYARCRASQELISAQIPWAFAGAERSRQAAGRGGEQRRIVRPSLDSDRTRSRTDSQISRSTSDGSELTQEEQLLAALLAANEDLMEALRLYDDLERVGIEREAEERSRKETRIDRSHLRYQDVDHSYLDAGFATQGGTSSSRSASPSSPSLSPAPSFVVTPVVQAHSHPLPPIPTHGPTNPTHHAPPLASQGSIQSLAPPPHAPFGPRSPASSMPRSRTPSPDRSSVHQNMGSRSSLEGSPRRLTRDMGRLGVRETDSMHEDMGTPVKPSAKALGKRKVVEPAGPDVFDSDDMFCDNTDESLRPSDDNLDSDSEDGGQYRAWHQPTHYVYDAAAERTQQRIREGRLAAAALVGGVH